VLRVFILDASRVVCEQKGKRPVELHASSFSHRSSRNVSKTCQVKELIGMNGVQLYKKIIAKCYVKLPFFYSSKTHWTNSSHKP
jgi:hypothetical protein